MTEAKAHEVPFLRAQKQFSPHNTRPLPQEVAATKTVSGLKQLKYQNPTLAQDNAQPMVKKMFLIYASFHIFPHDHYYQEDHKARIISHMIQTNCFEAANSIPASTTRDGALKNGLPLLRGD